jgi:hypothetical protein
VVNAGKVTVGVTSCAGSTRPCGVCSILGPVDNLAADAGDIDNHRCTGNTHVQCTTTANCTATRCLSGTNDGATCSVASQCPGGTCVAAGGTCEYYFGSYLPLVAGAVATCVGNQINGVITGTANIETGSAATAANLISTVFSGPTSAAPCPHCVGDGAANDGTRGGTCDAGDNLGLKCDINGTSPNLFWASTSLDCPPTSAALIATLAIDLTNSTGTRTKTLSAASPNCRANGFTTLKCFCDTCNNTAGTICASNADCVAVGATICGGRRCANGVNLGNPCSLLCLAGANAGTPCAVNSECPGSSCSSNAQCPSTCSGGSNPGGPCGVNSECPGGACQAACSVPGSATRPNQCNSPFTCSATSTCVGGGNVNANCSAASECPGGACVLANEGVCSTGPFEQFCGPIATFQGCTSNTQCAPYNLCVGGGNAGADCGFASECPSGTCTSKKGGPFDQCIIGKFRDCFTDNGVSGNSIVATGFADLPVQDQSNPTLSAVFCVGPTAQSAVNSAAGLPGPGRLELLGHSKAFP